MINHIAFAYSFRKFQKFIPLRFVAGVRFSIQSFNLQKLMSLVAHLCKIQFLLPLSQTLSSQSKTLANQCTKRMFLSQKCILFVIVSLNGIESSVIFCAPWILYSILYKIWIENARGLYIWRTETSEYLTFSANKWFLWWKIVSVYGNAANAR